jgi:hypothetical protein
LATLARILCLLPILHTTAAFGAALGYEPLARLDAEGLFAADRYIFPEHIDHVERDRLVLSVCKEDLLRPNATGAATRPEPTKLRRRDLR